MSPAIVKFQKESERKRKRAAFLGALLITLAVFAIWALSLPSKFNRETRNQTESTSPIRAFSGILKSSFEKFKAGL